MNGEHHQILSIQSHLITLAGRLAIANDATSYRSILKCGGKPTPRSILHTNAMHAPGPITKHTF